MRHRIAGVQVVWYLKLCNRYTARVLVRGCMMMHDVCNAQYDNAGKPTALSLPISLLIYCLVAPSI